MYTFSGITPYEPFGIFAAKAQNNFLPYRFLPNYADF